LLGDDDEQVRGMAAVTVGHMRSVPLSRLRWDVETSPQVRALILVAACRQDITQATEWLGQALREQAVVRVAAAYAIATHGLPWSAAVTEAVVSGCADGDPLEGWEWDQSWLSTVACSVDAGVVPELLAALARSEHCEVRSACVYAAIDAMNVRRSLPQALVPVLASMLADSDVGVVRAAVSAVRMSGVAAQAAVELAALTSRQLELESLTSADPRVSAVCALVEIGDPRWRGHVLAGQLPHGVVTAMVDAAVPMDVELLAAVHATLANGPSHNDRIALVRLLGSWGEAARAALPEVLAALDQADRVAPQALAAIAPDAPQVREALAQATGNVRAAKVLYDLTGDPQPLLDACPGRERGSSGLTWAIVTSDDRRSCLLVWSIGSLGRCCPGLPCSPGRRHRRTPRYSPYATRSPCCDATTQDLDWHGRTARSWPRWPACFRRPYAPTG
jgi:hypothetical protein